MRRLLIYTLLAPVPLVLVGCSQNGAASAAPVEDWLARAAAIVRVTDDPEQTLDCEYITALAVPDGWDAKLENLTSAEEDAVRELRFETARAGGNLVLLISAEAPLAEAYLCTE